MKVEAVSCEFELKQYAYLVHTTRDTPPMLAQEFDVLVLLYWSTVYLICIRRTYETHDSYIILYSRVP